MNNLDLFNKYLEEQVRNNSIYVWGGQGQNHEIISEKWIRKMETSAKNAERAISFWKKRVQQGYGKALRAFDCSGLGMYFLYNLSGLSKSDMSSNSMMKRCNMLKREDVKRGDWVFRVYTSGVNKGRAYHIGYIADDRLNVIQAKGRDEGVLRSHIDAYGKTFWNAFGRPEYFREEIEGNQPPAAWQVSRVLKLRLPRMRGTDVRDLQKALIAAGFSCGKAGADGIFGRDTERAVLAFQTANGLARDGKAGKQTVTALGGVWKS